MSEIIIVEIGSQIKSCIWEKVLKFYSYETPFEQLGLLFVLDVTL